MKLQFSAEAREEWRAHWKLVVASAFGASMMSIATTSLGAYMAPLEHEFGWSRAEVSSGLTLFAVAGVVFAPVLGILVDRWGPRRFGVPGIMICGATFALFSTATASIAYWFALWFLFSVAAQASRPLLWVQGVSSEFKASRGTALAVMMAGSGIGNLIAPVLAGYLIDAFGWRQAYLISGIGWGGISGLVCYLYFYGRSDRLRSAAPDEKTVAVDLPGVSAREGFMSVTFVKLAVGTLLAHTVIMALWVHIIPLLSSHGIQRSDAIWLGGLLGIAATVGQLLSGALADRFPGHVISAAYVLSLTLVCGVLLMSTESVLLCVIPVVMLGLFGGAQTHVISYLTTRYFGLRAFGKIFGVVASMVAITVGLGPLLAGIIFDRTHNYDLLLMGGIPVAVVAAGLIFSLGRYPDDVSKPH